MKNKIIKGSLSAVLTGLMLTTSVNAQTAVPNYPMHGNRCGKVLVSSAINRDVHIRITQNGLDGHCIFYDEVIKANSTDKVLEFEIEGSNEADYTIDIGVPKYIGSKVYKEYSEKLTVPDTDEMDNNVSCYQFSYTANENTLDEVSSSSVNESINESGTVKTDRLVLFPISDKLLGDANDDGMVNVTDAAFIAYTLAKRKDLPDNADYNEDDLVNVRDAASIAKFLAEKKRISKT